MKFKGEQPNQEGEIQSQEAKKEKKSPEEFKQMLIKEAKEGREKLEQYGKIGQKVRIKDCVWGGLVGEIVAIETNVPFSDETLDKWNKENEVAIPEGLPKSRVRVYITGGVNERGEKGEEEELKGSRANGLLISEWEPVENEDEKE